MKTRACSTTAVKNFFTGFRENTIKGLVFDDVSQTDGRTSLHAAFFLDAFAKLRKANISFVTSVCPSAWNNWALTGRIFLKMKFDI